MSTNSLQISTRFYSGVWGVMARFFKVPREAPTLPTASGQTVDAFKPARGYLNRMRVEYFIGIAVTTLIMFGTVIGVSVASMSADMGWLVAIVTFPLAVVAEILIAMFGFLAIHLKYDTMWYVMNDRSIRIRRGIWLIREATITFENVQNVSVHQGPVQRFFGIANVLIETAGGGGAIEPGKGSMLHHQGLIEGVADPHRIRELIMSRLKTSRSAGLGDEDVAAIEIPTTAGLAPHHLALLREVRDAAQAAAGPSGSLATG